MRREPPITPDAETSDDATLRALIEQIADQLCLTVGGQFDFLIKIDGEDDTAEKLQMLTNFVLATARRSIEEVQRVKDRLQEELEERRRAEQQIAYLQEEVETAKALGPLVGRSTALRNVRQQIEVVAPTDASVLIVGESGTGKELVARAIHGRSQRKDQPLVRTQAGDAGSLARHLVNTSWNSLEISIPSSFAASGFEFICAAIVSAAVSLANKCVPDNA